MKRLLITIIFLAFFAFKAGASPVLPARVGGSVTVDGVELTSATGSGYVFTATALDGKGFFPPAEDRDGLNRAGKYIIDIPIYDPTSQPEGAKTGSIAIIHVYRNGVELKVNKPVKGECTVGKGGTIVPVDLVISSTSQPSAEKK